MYSRIVFYNHFHNGDIHVSREFVRKLSHIFRQKFPGVTISYCHRNDAGLLADIDGLAHNTHLLNWSEHEGVFVRGDTIFINTWYAQRKFMFMNQYGITFDCLYSIFDDICKTHFGFSLNDIESDPKKWFPTIDFSKYEIGNARIWLGYHLGKKVFVETGAALSGQAQNFTMTPIIIALANKHLNTQFILSNQEGNFSLPSNVTYSSSIINKSSRFDLNENSFLATHCDVIIGRASGPFTFALTQENLFRRTPTFLCFSNLVPTSSNKFWLSGLMKDRIDYSAKFIVADESNPEKVSGIIDSNL